tara:strand:- start:1798 stop:2376 length:579 start_codon:yes stop_codon:yes gene_type:complete
MLGFTSIAATPIADEAVTTYVVLSASLVGTTAVGSVSLVTDQILAQTGLAAVCINGVVAINTGTGAVINAGASVGTTAVGSVAVTTGTGVAINVTGVYGQSVINGVTAIGNSTAPTVGLEATGFVSAVTQRTTANVPVSVSAMVASVSGVTATGSAVIIIQSGLEASAEVGSVLVWGQVVPDVDQIWTQIAA